MIRPSLRALVVPGALIAAVFLASGQADGQPPATPPAPGDAALPRTARRPAGTSRACGVNFDRTPLEVPAAEDPRPVWPRWSTGSPGWR